MFCSNPAHSVKVKVTSLSGTVVLQNNGGDNLVISEDGEYPFKELVAQDANYNVTVLSQPAAQKCTVKNGSGTIHSAGINNVGVSCVPITATLTASLSDMALSVSGHTEYGIISSTSSGTPRRIKITNTGTEEATHLVVKEPTWPDDTKITSNDCNNTLYAGTNCNITIAPGGTATSDGTNPCSLKGTAPVPGIVEVTADNAKTVSIEVVVLDYRCIYQGGYVYALDDSPFETKSVGGKVAAPTNQSDGIMWSSNSEGSYDYTAIYGISNSSKSSAPVPNSGNIEGQKACNGTTDGWCDTNNIYLYYKQLEPPIVLSSYAAGLCKQKISNYADWYLPSLCELGYAQSDFGSGCGSSTMPSLQNMQSSLVDDFTSPFLGGYYWSSTQDSTNTSNNAWYHYFTDASISAAVKRSLYAVRCSRTLNGP